MNSDVTVLRNMFATNAKIFESATSDIPDDKWLLRAGQDSNHMTWITGHAVIHRAKVSKILGHSWSAPWENLFERGGKLVAPEQYPSPAELQRAWKEVSEKLSGSLEAVTPEVWSKAVPEGTFSLDGTVGGSVGVLCLHETYHMGQLAFLKKMLGCGQTVG